MKKVKVKGMKGLSVFHQNKVCNINNVIDGAKSHRFEPPSQPVGRRLDFHSFDHPGGISRAPLRIKESHRGQRLNGRPRFVQFKNGILHPLAGQRGNFSGNSQVTEAISPVGRYRHLKYRIIQLKGLGQGCSGAKISFNHQNSGMITADVQLFLGTDHPVRDLAPYFGLFYFHSAREFRSDPGKRHILPVGNIGGTTNHRKYLFAVVDHANL